MVNKFTKDRTIQSDRHRFLFISVLFTVLVSGLLSVRVSGEETSAFAAEPLPLPTAYQCDINYSANETTGKIDYLRTGNIVRYRVATFSPDPMPGIPKDRPSHGGLDFEAVGDGEFDYIYIEGLMGNDTYRKISRDRIPTSESSLSLDVKGFERFATSRPDTSVKSRTVTTADGTITVAYEVLYESYEPARQMNYSLTISKTTGVPIEYREYNPDRDYVKVKKYTNVDLNPVFDDDTFVFQLPEGMEFDESGKGVRVRVKN